jgi:hypothetical protein
VVTVTFAGSIFAATEGSAPPAEQPDWLVKASMQHPAINERSQRDTAFFRRCRYTPRTPPTVDDEFGETIEQPFFEKICLSLIPTGRVLCITHKTVAVFLSNIKSVIFLIMMPER